MNFESQDATKITSAPADSSIYSFMKMTTLDINHFFSVSHSSVSSSVVTMPTSKAHWYLQSEQCVSGTNP